jgi:nucleoside-triphosphatase THEP1
VRAIRALLASDKVIIATIAAKGAGFIAEVKKRDDILLREVTRANRVELPEELVQWIEARCR